MPHTKDKLTVATVKSATHAGEDLKLSDGGGLYLHIQRSGKYWRLKYRYNGREKLLALGVFPKTSLAKARREREKAKEELSQGIDPSAHRRATRISLAEAALEAVGREWWESVHRPQGGTQPRGAELAAIGAPFVPDAGEAARCRGYTH